MEVPSQEVQVGSSNILDAPARNITFLLHTMGDVDETARLWKVNRTIHELVKDRVSGDSDTFSILT